MDQDTRINVKIKADQETEINGAGPVINEYQLAELEAVLSSVSADDVVVLLDQHQAILEIRSITN